MGTRFLYPAFSESVLAKAEKAERLLAKAIDEGRNSKEISDIAAKSAELYAYATIQAISVQNHQEAIECYERGLLLSGIALRENPKNNRVRPVFEFYSTRKDYPYPLLRGDENFVKRAAEEALQRAEKIGYM